MLLPDKHVTLSESTLGLGAFVLGILREPMSPDEIHAQVMMASQEGTLPARHDFDGVIRSVLFLYAVGTVEATEEGEVRRCVS